MLYIKVSQIAYVYMILWKLRLFTLSILFYVLAFDKRQVVVPAVYVYLNTSRMCNHIPSTYLYVFKQKLVIEFIKLNLIP